jgi:hypothetical protein
MGDTIAMEDLMIHIQKSGRARVILAVLLWLLLIIVLWLFGWVGRGVTRATAAWVLPRSADDDWRIESLAFTPPAEDLERGITITVHPQRLREDLHRLSSWFRWLPPDTIRDGLCLQAFWAPSDIPLLHTHPVPVLLLVKNAASHAPHVRARIKAQEFNAIFKDEQSDRRTRREDYIFGHYDLTQEYHFETLKISSEPVDHQGLITARRLHLNATGTVRARFKDGIVKARTTGNVKRLKGVFDVSVQHHEDGVGIQYHVDITDMKVTANNMAPWLEKKLMRELRDSLEHSANRERKQRRLAKKRAPAWAPVDVDIDFALVR